MVKELGKTAKNKINAAAGKKLRSAAYPMLSLPAAIDAAKKIFENLGIGPHSRDALARGLGYASFSGAASGKIGAMVHFGLLERFAGSYSAAPLAEKIFDFSRADRAKEIFEAATKPALFASLAARFSGQVLPKDLPLVLVSDYHIASKAAQAAACNFVKTFEFAELLKNNRLVLPGAEENGEASDVLENKTFEKENSLRVDEDKNKNEGIEVKLDSGIAIVFPKKFSSRLALGEFAQDLKNLENRAGL